MEELESLRKKFLYKKLLYYFIILILIIIVTLNFKGFEDKFAFGFIVLIFGYILVKNITSKDLKKIKTLYKQIVVIPIFNSIFTDIKFNLDKGMGIEPIVNTNMMYTGDYYFSNDHITGKYKNIKFELSDLMLKEESEDSDGNKHYRIIFKGQWFIFDFNKPFKADIQVYEKTFKNAKKCFFWNKEFQKIKLEDIDFNKKFNVYTKNELEAFYVLTPNIIEKIKETNDKTKGKLLLCFVDNKLHIGLHNDKDLFEPSVYKKINLESAKEKTKKEISIITDFIDILSLDNDLFK